MSQSTSEPAESVDVNLEVIVEHIAAALAMMPNQDQVHTQTHEYWEIGAAQTKLRGIKVRLENLIAKRRSMK